MSDICSTTSEVRGYGVVLGTDCRVLRTERATQKKGHLGSHPWNLATILASDKFRSWRVRQYIKLYYTLTSTKMIMEDGESGKALVDFCNKGCHRSRAWGFIQTAILKQMGFRVCIDAICMKAMFFNCANPQRECCEECRYDHPDVKEVLKVATDEFFEVICALEHL